MNRILVISLILSAVVGGCATHRTVWDNPQYRSNDELRRALERDKAQCNGLAWQQFSPHRSSLSQQQPQQQEYKISGTYRNSYGGGVGYYDGTVTSGGEPTTMSDAFLDTLNRLNDLDDQTNYNRARDNAERACLYQRGWQELGS